MGGLSSGVDLTETIIGKILLLDNFGLVVYIGRTPKQSPMVRVVGLQPTASASQMLRPKQLDYTRILAAPTGFEPVMPESGH